MYASPRAIRKSVNQEAAPAICARSASTSIAVLLVDLQRDFLGAEGSRMPVDAGGAQKVLDSANAILAKRALACAVPVMVVNEYRLLRALPTSSATGAALSGSPGAQIDSRVRNAGQVKVISKSRPSAFSNPQLKVFLQASGVKELFVMGVFAEGCVRATVLDALRHGYKVNVISDAVATNRTWKKRFALWAMKRAGAVILPSLALDGTSRPS